MQIVSGGVTDVGRVRTNNEDCFRIVAPLHLFVLSDGMGGEAHGEVASALAVETVVKHCIEALDNPAVTLYGEQQAGWSEKTKRLSSAAHLANKRIFSSAQEHLEQHGMGATLTAAWIDGSKLSIAHVGDSRAYLLRSGTLQQLTSDHSLVAEQVRKGILTAVEAEESQMQSVLLRALGSQAEVEGDAGEYMVIARDILLLCSDGLTRMVIEPEIAGTLHHRDCGAHWSRVKGLVFMAAPRGAETCGRQRDRGRKVSMAKLSLMFESRLVKEVPIGSRAVGIGRSPDNDLPVDNPAVSNHHARVFFEAGRLVVEDLDSLNGTFVNDLRVERATLHDGDSIWIGKHHIKVDASGDVPISVDAKRKPAVSAINETMVLSASTTSKWMPAAMCRYR